jgi:hypothetical protein
MGLRRSYLDYIEKSIERVFGDAQGLSMLELGDQVIDDPAIPEKTGKAYFERRGFEHVSVDLNGRHGALVRDLTKPEQFRDCHNRWDIITNAGTTEHVEPFESQYECFGMLHDCLKPGGIAIHIVPDVEEHDNHGAWRNHCRYYYSQFFFELLAAENKYEMLSNTVINGLRCAAVRKVEAVPFTIDRGLFLHSISRREMTFTPTRLLRNLLTRIGL